MSDDAGHLAARVAMDVAGHDHLAITVRSQIPVARGLGSSAALAVAAAAAAGSTDPLGVAARVDGHPENAAASFVGGLVVASTVQGAVRAVRLTLDPTLVFVVAVPDRALSTSKARQALPPQVSREDAAFNLGRMGLLVAGLADHRLLMKEAAEDRLHQNYRGFLFPEAQRIMEGMQEGGAAAVCWSGSGPSLLAITVDADAPAVRAATVKALATAEVPGEVLVLHADLRGLVTGEGARLPSIDDAGGATLPGPAAGAPGAPRDLFDFDSES